MKHQHFTVLHAEDSEDDIRKSYMLGASSYHVKPTGQDELVRLLDSIVAYWKNCEVPAIDLTGRRLRTDRSRTVGRTISREPRRSFVTVAGQQTSDCWALRLLRKRNSHVFSLVPRPPFAGTPLPSLFLSAETALTSGSWCIFAPMLFNPRRGESGTST